MQAWPRVELAQQLQQCRILQEIEEVIASGDDHLTWRCLMQCTAISAYAHAREATCPVVQGSSGIRRERFESVQATMPFNESCAVFVSPFERDACF